MTSFLRKNFCYHYSNEPKITIIFTNIFSVIEVQVINNYFPIKTLKLSAISKNRYSFSAKDCQNG